MAVRTLLTLAGAQTLPKLAPDLTFLTDRALTTVDYAQITAIDATGGTLTTILSITGKFEIQLIDIASISANDLRKVKITIDGVVIYSETGISVNGTSLRLIGEGIGESGEHLRCDDSFLFELDTNADSSITFNYKVRPIL